MKLFTHTETRFFIICLLIIAACITGIWFLTDNSRPDPLEVQNTNYHNIKKAIGGNELPIQQQRYSARFICPVDPSFNRYLTSEFGVRESPNDGEYRDHKGIDITGGSRCQIRATDSGIVWEVGRNQIDGLFVTILHRGGYRSRYCHLSTVFVKRKQTVETGEVIGRMGSSGRTTGEHLHFELWQYGTALDAVEVLRIVVDEERKF